MEARSAEITVIQPQRGWKFPDLREVWAHRDLIYFMARRDVVVRYNQAVIGVFWTVLQPIFLAAVFAFFLGVLQKIDADYDGVPYALFTFTSLVVWLPFTDAVSRGAESTVGNEALISKIYFPRILIPFATLAPAVVDFVFGFVILFFVALAYGYGPSLAMLTVPFFLVLTMATALGFGLWLSALNVKYRDVHLLVPLLILTGLFVSPIFYPLDFVPQQFGDSQLVEAVYSLNPMAGILEGFRWAILGTDFPGWLLLVPVCTSVFLLVTGALYFNRAERTFADVI